MTAEPGPWRNERTPYLPGIMDATVEPGVEVVVCLKPVQVGFSESLRNLIGFWVDHDPGPAMLVLPNQQSAEEMIEERIRPLLTETPRLKRHMGSARSDNKKSAIRLDTMTLYTGWAGSPQALASRPIRYLPFDEVDKYPPFAGKEADPISLGLKRLTTYGHRARAIIGSTPTTRHGNVWQWWESCTDRRHYYVPCPKCGESQRLLWAQVKYPKALDGEDDKAHAERVEANELALYECSKCQSRWSNADKNGAVRKGEWRSETPGASNRRVGFHLNSIYSPWLSMSKLAGEWIRAQGDPSRLMDFRNSRLAEPFEEQSSKVAPSVIAEKRKLAGPPMVVPEWGRILLATADVQKDHLYWVVRAWGYNFRSQLVAHGIAVGFEDVAKRTIERAWPRADTGEAMYVGVLGVDAQYRTDEVLAFAQRDPARIWPMAGAASVSAAPVTERKVQGYPGVIRRDTNPNYWKDVLHSRIADDDQTHWLPHNQVDDTYCRHMASEHKVLDPKTRTFAWVPVSSGAANHFWDCEYMQGVLAQLCGVAAIPSDEELTREVQIVQSDQRGRESESVGGWLSAHKGRW